MGVKGGKRPEGGFPRGKVDVLKGASSVTDWCFSRLNQLSALGFGRRAKPRCMSKKWEWVKTGLRGNRKRTRRPKSYVLRLNRFLMRRMRSRDDDLHRWGAPLGGLTSVLRRFQFLETELDFLVILQQRLEQLQRSFALFPRVFHGLLLGSPLAEVEGIPLWGSIWAHAFGKVENPQAIGLFTPRRAGRIDLRFFPETRLVELLSERCTAEFFLGCFFQHLLALVRGGICTGYFLMMREGQFGMSLFYRELPASEYNVAERAAGKPGSLHGFLVFACGVLVTPATVTEQQDISEKPTARLVNGEHGSKYAVVFVRSQLFIADNEAFAAHLNPAYAGLNQTGEHFACRVNTTSTFLGQQQGVCAITEISRFCIVVHTLGSFVKIIGGGCSCGKRHETSACVGCPSGATRAAFQFAARGSEKLVCSY